MGKEMYGGSYSRTCTPKAVHPDPYIGNGNHSSLTRSVFVPYIDVA